MKYYKTPITANFIVTRNCNGNCIFCGVEHMSDKKVKDVDSNQLKTIIDKLYDKNILRINFFGGEPLVYKDITDLVRYAKEKEFFTTLITNGMIWHKEFSDFSNTLDGIAVSIHGSMANHCKLTRSNEKQYQIIRKNMEKINELKIPLTINMTVTANNYMDIKQLVEDLKDEYDIKAFAFNRYISNPELPEELSNSFKLSIKQINETLKEIDGLAKKYKDTVFKYAIHFPLCIVENQDYIKYVGDCGFGQSYVSIDCDGNIQPCSYTYKKLGNIFDDDLEEIWNKDSMLTEYRKLDWLPDKCKKCQLFDICHAGCKETRNCDFSYDEILDEVITSEKV